MEGAFLAIVQMTRTLSAVAAAAASASTVLRVAPSIASALTLLRHNNRGANRVTPVEGSAPALEGPRPLPPATLGRPGRVGGPCGLRPGVPCPHREHRSLSFSVQALRSWSRDIASSAASSAQRSPALTRRLLPRCAKPELCTGRAWDAGQLGVAGNRTLFAAGTRQLADVGALDLCQALACSPNRAQLVRGLSPCVG